MDEFKDARLKYIELPKQFTAAANEISLTCKQHLRICEALAKRLVNETPKTAAEFEKIEYYKNFVIKSSQLNDLVLGLLDYIHTQLKAIAADSIALDVALKNDTLRLQSETIELLQKQLTDITQLYHDSRRNQVASK